MILSLTVVPRVVRRFRFGMLLEMEGIDSACVGDPNTRVDYDLGGTVVRRVTATD